MIRQATALPTQRLDSAPQPRPSRAFGAAVPDSVLPTGPLPVAVGVYFFTSLFDTGGLPWRGSHARLAERMSTFPVRKSVDDKRKLPCWSPCSPWGTPEAALVCALVLDIDEGTTVEEALDRCGQLALVLHTTWSHTEAAPRFRILLPLARPVPAALWTPRWQAATTAFGLRVDPACKDARRRYLLPATPAADAPRHYVVALNRPALDILDIPLPPEPAVPRVRIPRPELHVPARLRDQAVRARLMTDPDCRERAALELGAKLGGLGEQRRAGGIVCPRCGRPSVWFFIAPGRLRQARCNHRRSCNWAGRLDELLSGWAA